MKSVYLGIAFGAHIVSVRYCSMFYGCMFLLIHKKWVWIKWLGCIKEHKNVGILKHKACFFQQHALIKSSLEWNLFHKKNTPEFFPNPITHQVNNPERQSRLAICYLFPLGCTSRNEFPMWIERQDQHWSKEHLNAYVDNYVQIINESLS